MPPGTSNFVNPEGKVNGFSLLVVAIRAIFSKHNNNTKCSYVSVQLCLANKMCETDQNTKCSYEFKFALQTRCVKQIRTQIM